jgi:hypothetical protein
MQSTECVKNIYKVQYVKCFLNTLLSLYYRLNVTSPVNVASPSMALPDTKAS